MVLLCPLKRSHFEEWNGEIEVDLKGGKADEAERFCEVEAAEESSGKRRREA